MKAGDDPRTDQSGSKNVPDPPSNSEPVKAPDTVAPGGKNAPGTPGPGSGTGGGGGDKR